MKWRISNPSWFVSDLVLIVVVTTGVEFVVAQSKTDTPRIDSGSRQATFELLGEHVLVNVNNIAYVSDEGDKFDIFFACSSARNLDPLRFTDEKDIRRARAYFGDENRRRHYAKINHQSMNK